MESESSLHRARGGWITFPFIIATVAGLSLSSGLITNLITFLKDEFHFEETDAAKITNYVNGSITFIPIIAAIIADSFAGCYSVICFSSLVSLLGIVLLLLSAAMSQLRPPSCEKGSILCRHPSALQCAVVYVALGLVSVGNGGTRFSVASMGADQLDSTRHPGIFFNWYIFTLYVANFISATLLVYVEENVSWVWGLGIFAIVNVIGLAVFVCGARFYRFLTPKGSPFKALLCVLVAAVNKRNMPLSQPTQYYHHHGDASQIPTPFFKFLNRAALKSLDESRTEGSMISPWTLCTVQQVEDLKRLIKIVPLWLSGVILSIPIAVQISFMIIQGKTMDNHLYSHFSIPVASIQVCALISTCVTISLLDRLVFPLWVKLAPARPLTPLQRVGIGHSFTILSMVVAVVVESKRLSVASSHNLREQIDAVVPMSLLWLAILGVSEGFHFAGQVAFCYQEFPTPFKSTAIAVVALTIAGAFYFFSCVEIHGMEQSFFSKLAKQES